MTTSSSLALHAGDGHRLAVTVHEPVMPEANLVFAGGTGIPRRFYRHFVGFLVASGFRVFTFDYRGLGDSLDPAWPGERLRMADWGRRDLEAVLVHVRWRFPGEPLVYVGHSVGGQILGLAPSARHLRAALLVTSQSGYWKLWPGLWRVRRWLDWHLVLPLLTRLFGRLPGAVLGGAPLPPGIVREWGSWCRHPRYLNENGEAMRDHFDALRLPMRFYHVSDDDVFAPLAAVRALQGFYTLAGSEIVTVTPGQAGLRKLGHFGFFRADASALWSEAVAWLRRQAGLTALAPPVRSAFNGGVGTDTDARSAPGEALGGTA